MENEFTKRPFLRLLILWVGGICSAAYIPLNEICPFAVFVLSVVIFLLLYYGLQENKRFPEYTQRWCWGALFSLLLYLLSISYTYVCLNRDSAEIFVPFRDLCRNMQLELLESFDHLSVSESQKNVLGTISLGYRQELNWATRRSFSLAGAAHILAVSGFHVGVVYSFIRVLLMSVPSSNRKICIVKYLIQLCAVWIFASLTGLAASAVRAALMLSLYIISRMLNRKTDSFNIAMASAFCMLVFDPFYLFDLGFELSYAAVFSILFFYRRISAFLQLRNPIVKELWLWFVISLSAQIGVLPLCLYYFGEVSSVALLSALPVTLFSSLLIPAALLWSVLFQFGITNGILNFIVSWLVKYFVEFIERMGQIPPFSVSMPYSGWMLFLTYILLFWACIILIKVENKNKGSRMTGPTSLNDLNVISSFVEGRR